MNATDMSVEKEIQQTGSKAELNAELPSRETQSSKAESGSLKAETCSLRAEIQSLKAELEIQNLRDQAMKLEIESLKLENKNLKKENTFFRRTNALLNSKVGKISQMKGFPVQNIDIRMPADPSAEAEEAVNVLRDEFPMQKNGLPMQNDELPKQMDGLPMQRNGFPAQMDELPVQRNELPVQRVELPVQRDEPPVQRNELPMQRNELPGQRDELPGQRDESPAKSLSVQDPQTPGSTPSAKILRKVNGKVELALGNVILTDGKVTGRNLENYYRRGARRRVRETLSKLLNTDKAANIYSDKDKLYKLALFNFITNNFSIKNKIWTIAHRVSMTRFLIYVSLYNNFTKKDAMSAAGISKSTFGRFIKELKLKGWLEAYISEDEKFYFLTAEGKKVLESVKNTLPVF